MEPGDAVLEGLILDLVEWLGDRERTYQETMEAWRTSCPRLQVWEEANIRGLVTIITSDERSVVKATSLGLLLAEVRRLERRPVSSTAASRG